MEHKKLISKIEKCFYQNVFYAWEQKDAMTFFEGDVDIVIDNNVIGTAYIEVEYIETSPEFEGDNELPPHGSEGYFVYKSVEEVLIYNQKEVLMQNLSTNLTNYFQTQIGKKLEV